MSGWLELVGTLHLACHCDESPVGIAGMHRRHGAVKPEHQRTQCYMLPVSQTPTGGVSAFDGAAVMLQNAGQV